MTSQEYKFSNDRYISLVDSSSKLVSVLDSLKFLLDNRIKGGDRIAPHTVNESDIIFLLESVNSNNSFVEIKDLEEANRRMLRYAFRDWKEEVLASIRGSQLYSTIEKHDLLKIDNVKLFSIPGDWGEFEWKVCLGYQFNSYGDNFLPDNVGPYKPLANTNDSRVKIEIPGLDEQIDVNSDTSEDLTLEAETYQKTAPLVYVKSNSIMQSWVHKNWKWLLAFCIGFLIASIISWFVTNCCECDFSDRLEELLSKINQD